MSVQKISETEIDERLISNLPTRPNAPTSMGGKGYSAAELKSAFDSLPKLIAERYNELIDDLTNPEGSEIIKSFKPEGLSGESLEDFFESVKESTILDRLIIDGDVLSYYLRALKSEVESLRSLIEGKSVGG